MLDTTRYDDELPGTEVHVTLRQPDRELAAEDQEQSSVSPDPAR